MRLYNDHSSDKEATTPPHEAELKSNSDVISSAKDYLSERRAEAQKKADEFPKTYDELRKKYPYGAPSNEW